MAHTFKSARESLSERFDLPWKVRIYKTFWDPGEHGLSKVNTKNKTAIIKVNKELPEIAQIDVLIHEYAHLVSWDYYGTHRDVVWGVAYAECYDAVYGSH